MSHIVGENSYATELNDLLKNLTIKESPHKKDTYSLLEQNTSSTSTFSHKISSKNLSSLPRQSRISAPSPSMLTWSNSSFYHPNESVSICYERSDKHYSEQNYNSYKSLRAMLSALIPLIKHALSGTVDAMKEEFNKHFNKAYEEICSSSVFSQKEIADLKNKSLYAVILIMNVIAKEAQPITAISVNTEVQEINKNKNDISHSSYQLFWYRDIEPQIRWHAHVLIEFEDGLRRVVIEFLPSTNFMLTQLNIQKVEELLKLVKRVVIATPNSMNSFYFKLTPHKMQQINTLIHEFTQRTHTCRNPVLSGWELEKHEVQFVCADNPLIESDWFSILDFRRAIKPLTVLTELSHFANKYYYKQNSVSQLQSMLFLSTTFTDTSHDHHHHNNDAYLPDHNDSICSNLQKEETSNMLDDIMEDRSIIRLNREENEQQQQQQQQQQQEQEQNSNSQINDAIQNQQQPKDSLKPLKESTGRSFYELGNSPRISTRTSSTEEGRSTIPKELAPLKTPKKFAQNQMSPHRIVKPLGSLSQRKKSADLMDLAQQALNNLSIDDKAMTTTTTIPTTSTPTNALSFSSNKIQFRRPPKDLNFTSTQENTKNHNNNDRRTLNLPPLEMVSSYQQLEKKMSEE